MDVAAGIVGLLAGVLVSPLADRIATNAPLHDPLLRSVPRSSRLALVLLGTAALGGACGLVFGFTLEAAAATLLCWVLVVITRTDFEHRLIPDKVVLPGAVLVLVLRTIDDPGVEWILSALGAGLAVRAARQRGAEDGDPVRAVPGARRRRRAFLGRRDSRLVQGPRGLVVRHSSL